MAVTYATVSDLSTYVQDSGVTLPSGDPAKERLINRAEFDIDSIVGPFGQTVTVGDQELPLSTIEVLSTENIPSTGTILVAGQSVTYTGKTLDTFTGASGGTGEIPEGSPVVFRAASGLKFDPITRLTAVQRDALKRATCAQAEYRAQMGERFFIEAQYSRVSGPDFSQQGTLPRIGPKVYAELQGFGLLSESPVG